MSARLDRTERALERLAVGHEEFRKEYKLLLKPHVDVHDRRDKRSENVDRLVQHGGVQDRRIPAVDDRVETLVKAIREWLRKQS